MSARRTSGSRSGVLALLALAVLALVGVASGAHGALPPGYGGELRFPAPSALSLPSALGDGQPFGETLGGAVFDGLYALDDLGRVVPSLATAMPELAADGSLIVTLRENVRRHDRRTLRALDVARSLRRASRAQPHWLVGFAFDGPEVDVRVEGERTLRFPPPAQSLATPAATLARRLAAAPLAIDLGRGVGTGPYRAALRGGVLELRSFRAAARGAAYVDVLRFDPPRSREEELRAFELRQIDGSWHGASLYGQRDPDVREHALPANVAVLLVPRGPMREAFEALDRALDRRRFARVGLVPTSRLSDELPAPRASDARAPLPTSARLLVRAGDAFEADFGAALAAHLDERGVRLTLVSAPPERFERERASADLHLAYATPHLPGADALVAAALFAATGDAAAAGRALDAGPSVLATEASQLRALVLGHRVRRLHHRAPLLGVTHDPLGRLRLERLHLPRSATTPEEE